MHQDQQHRRIRHLFAHDDKPDPDNRQAPLNVEDGEIVEDAEIPRWVLAVIVLVVIALGIAGVILLN